MGNVSYLSNNSVIRRAEELVSSEIEGEVVLLSIESGQYYGMNPVLSRIWGLIGDGSMSVSGLLEKLLEEYDVSREKCEQDLLEALEKLRKEKLIVES